MGNRDQQAEQAVTDYLGKLFEAVGESPQLQVETKPPDELYVNVQGESDFFSSDREELSKALSVLVRVMLERQCGLDRDVQIDINGVQLSRRKNLEEFAVSAAGKAKRKGKKIRLNPMPPVERKWVHIALSDVDGIETYSVGEGEERRVIIKPT